MVYNINILCLPLLLQEVCLGNVFLFFNATTKAQTEEGKPTAYGSC